VTKEYLPDRGTGSAFTTHNYDLLSRPVTVSPATGGQITYQYTGNVTIVTDQEGYRKKTEFNETGKPKIVTEEDDAGNWGPQTTYSYDALGRLVQIIQGSQTRSYTYDSLGRRISEANPESGTVTFIYDDSGNVTQKTDARGVVTGYTYDALNRLLVTSYSDGTLSSHYNYDETSGGLYAKGRMTSAWTLNGNQQTAESVGYSWTYDSVGRVLQQVMHMDNTDYQATYSYMATGCGCTKKDLQSITYPDGSQVTYVRDEIERVISITPGYVSGMSYENADGSLSHALYGTNGSIGQEHFIKDSFGRLWWDLFMPQSYPNVDQVSLEYTFYQSGRVKDVYSSKGVFPNDPNPNYQSYKYSYNYDRLGRLSSETRNSGNESVPGWTFDWTHSWAYDRYGNIAGTASEQNNRLTAYAGNYDASGNQLQDASNSYLYDANNLIRQATRISDSAVLGTYRYDALGRRVKKSRSYLDNGQIRTVTYSYIYGGGGEILEEYKKDSTTSTVYEDSRTRNIYNGSKLIARTNEGTRNGAQFSTTSWPIRNHRNEEVYTVSTVPGGGVQVSENQYTGAFGSGGSDQFAGQKADDETGLKDFGARYYASSLLRWTSADPVTSNIYDPQSLNKYTYVRNDPVNLIDPDGRNFMQVNDDTHGVDDNFGLFGEFIHLASFEGDRDGIERVSIPRQRGRNSGGGGSACDRTNADNAKKLDWIKDHRKDAQKVADELNTNVENILGLSALESGWGKGPFVINGGNNYFGMYYNAKHPPAHSTGPIPGHKVQMAQYASYADSAESFALSRGGHLVTDIADATTFAQKLQDAGLYGIDPDTGKKVKSYVGDVVGTIGGIASRLNCEK
jgi:RHS repeat-associated protein